ncbi:MAG: hypothetical protein EOO38_14470, partial [Cytophagaceae bacterium]
MAAAGQSYQPSKMEKRAYALLTTLALSNSAAYAQGGAAAALSGVQETVVSIVQVIFAIILIVGMIVIYRQLNYVQSQHLGYDKQNLVYIPIEGELIKRYDLFKKEIGKQGGIVSVSKMRNSPTVIEHHTGSIGWPGKDPNHTISFADAVVGYDFVNTMKLQLKEGRDFSNLFGTDTASYMLSET